ncbi:ribose-5-phosphate isomerase [Maricaulis sp. W15]|uniref:ribose-5-phosphate isomerase RpiA n=1 Tax=Maricaulis sp. W15 TaxID=1772333 RepID=UPI000948B274|nr:ribose-5-phosphate isomerase RpiA [Maricaulis sp. W15]OLF72242.1 ribose-5-phosphate isomerase [Maricaulis sp. W15]
MSAERQKARAAAAALDYVEDGMTLGLGSGSTAEIFLRLLGEKVKDGLKVRGVPTSQRTAEVAVENGVPLIDVDHVNQISITIDGADEVDGRFQLIKGGGACLLREKIIANASDLMIVMVDETKLVSTLGKFPLPVEVDRFGFSLTAKQVYEALRKVGITSPDVQLRRKGDGLEPLVTDGGNYILDCACEAIPDAGAVDLALKAIPGVVEHGLFINLARVVIVGEDGDARVMEL